MRLEFPVKPPEEIAVVGLPDTGKGRWVPLARWRSVGPAWSAPHDLVNPWKPLDLTPEPYREDPWDVYNEWFRH